MSKPDIGSIVHIKKSMKYSGHRKLLCELSKFNLLGYETNTDASILVYKFRPERTSFNMYASIRQLQLTFLALHSCLKVMPHSLQIYIFNADHRRYAFFSA